MARLAFFVVLALFGMVFSDLVNEKVERTVDLTKQYALVTTVVDVKNTGSSKVSKVELAHDANLASHVSFVSASVKGKAVPATPSEVTVSIGAGETVSIEIVAIYTHVLAPYPTKISQQDSQKVRLTTNVYFTSPYATKEQKTKFTLAGPTESFTKFQPVKDEKTSIVYGPYKDVAAQASHDITLHFENNSPFLTTTSLLREIEVSHWGNVAVTETIDLHHTGAELEGGFSRLDFTRMPRNAPSAVKTFVTKLPAAAEDVYYRDVIGNVSTSHLRYEDKAAVLEVRPRFPLLGGWKTQYTVGYNLPSYQVLSHDGSAFSLKMRFVDHIYDDQVIDRATVRVILPEGASNIKVSFPSNYPVEGPRLENVVTYLDTFGRTVYVYEKTNLVEEHMQEFEVTYEFSQVMMLREPFMLIAFLFLVFAVAIVLNRIDFSIGASVSAEKKTN